MKIGILKGRSFREKAFIATFFVCAVFLSLLIPFSEHIVDRIVQNSLEYKVEEIAQEMQKCPDTSCMIRIIQSQENSIFFRITLLDDQLHVIYDAENLNSKGLDYAPSKHPEIQAAKESGKASRIHFSKEFTAKFAYAAQTFTAHDALYILRIALPFSELGVLVHQFREGLYTVNIIFMMTFFAIIGWVFYRLTRPIRIISDTIRPYAEGQVDVIPKIQLSSKISTDFERLAHTLNSLSDKIRQQIRRVIDEKNEKESILDSLIEGVAALDAEGIIRYVNPIFAKIIGLPRRELFNKGIFSLDSPKKEPLARAIVLVKLAQQKSSVVTDSIELEEGQRVFLDLIVVPKPYKSGIIIVIQDKSSQHQVVEMGKEFIANASHELRTPITIIKGFAETLQDLPSISKQMLTEITEKIVRNCQRMDTLVKNLLTLADLEHVPESRFQSSDLVAMVNHCVDFLKTLSPEAHVKIEKRDDRIMVDANADLLELALMNILQNGVKYSHPPAHLTIELGQKGDEVSVAIQDQGIGIPTEDLSHIFERFYTVDKAHSRRLGGAGLGLSIVKTIIDKHEGTISVASTLGKGTTFTITLPKSRRYSEAT